MCQRDYTERTECEKTRPPQPKKKGLPVPEGVKFLYFGRPESGSREHQGVVTVAWIESSPGILVMGFSFCSPADSWCKITGRKIAMKRLYEHPLVMPFLYSPKRTVQETVRAMLTHDFERLAGIAPGVTIWGTVPSWTKNLAKRLMDGTERDRRGKTLGEKLAWLRAQGLNPDFLGGIYIAPPARDLLFNIMARMMRDIAALGND
jgi:hypothetical protein